VLLPDLDANTKKKLICNGGINYELLGKLRALRDVFQSGFGRRSDRENKGLSLEEGLKPDIKTWMLRVFGLRIDKSLWYESEMVRDALDNTDAFLKKHKDDPLFADSNPTEAERISACQWSLPDGLSLKPDAFTGCDKLKENGRECVVIYPKGDPRGDGASAMSASFFLDKTPRTCVLTLEGRDDDKPGAVNIEISINDRTVFSGPNRAAETGWTRLMFPAEPNILSPGWNTLRISNLETTDKYFEKWFEIAAVSLQWKADEK
jgi:hypothetical protein